jgi:phytoene synthase
MLLDEDLRVCRDLLARGSKTFSSAARLLPTRMRDSVTVIYAFCRVADDTIDADPAASEATVDHLRERLDRIFMGTPGEDPVDRALADVVAREKLPRAPFDALLEGLVWDARGRRYETLDDLYAYAARVAGAIGALVTVLMGPRAAPVLARACDLGVAMQLTNIARDVGEDARLGRIYLPLAWLAEAGIDPEAFLRDPQPTAPLRRLVARLLERAEHLYHRADAGIPALPADCRIAIRAARLVYADIGRSIQREGFDSVTRRAHVPLLRKLWLLARSIGGRWLRARPEGAPPLPETQFLVAACGESA